MDQLLTPRQKSRLLKNSTLAWVIEKRPLVRDVQRGLIPMAPYFYQSQFWTDTSPIRAVLKARQIGLSAALAMECLHDAIEIPHHLSLILSRNLESAVEVLNHVKVALTTPDLGAPAVVKNAETQLKLANGSTIISTAATRSAGRTYAANRVYLDEFAFMAWPETSYQAVSPTTSRGGQLSIISSPNGRANDFYRFWVDDRGRASSKRVIPWYRCPHYNPKGWDKEASPTSRSIGEASDWFSTERTKYTRMAWAQEYGCSFVQSGLVVFSAEDIQNCLLASTGLREPVSRRSYVTFWDIGRRNDPTVGTTLDVSQLPFQVVAYERHHQLPYPEIQAVIAKRYYTYPGAHWVESNGIGDPVIENLSVPVQPWITSPKSKHQMITALSLAVESGWVAWPEELDQLTSEMLIYQWDDKNLVQDSVMSLSGAVVVSGVEEDYEDVASLSERVAVSPF